MHIPVLKDEEIQSTELTYLLRISISTYRELGYQVSITMKETPRPQLAIGPTTRFVLGFTGLA